MAICPSAALTQAELMAPAEPRFLTVAEAAALLSVCERTVYDALRARRLRGQKIGRLWRVKMEWMDEWGIRNRD